MMEARMNAIAVDAMKSFGAGDSETIDRGVDMASLAALTDYTDIHLNISKPADSVLFKSSRTRVPSELIPIITDLAKKVKIEASIQAHDTKDGSKSFMVSIGGQGYRTTAIRDREVYAMRRSSVKAPRLGYEVFMDDHIAKEMLSEDVKRSGGLVIVSGIPGSGKTWSTVAVIIKRLEMFGGYCLTIEDPPEMKIEGWIGDKGGYCEQMDATKKGYRECVATSLRCFPAQERAMMFIGEIREPEPAAEMLRIALGGHLVFTTVHAEDHAAACQRIVALAQAGGEPDAKHMLASSLKLSLNQRLEGGRPQATIMKTTAQISGSIERNDYAQFSNIVSEQNRSRREAIRQNSPVFRQG